MESALRWRIASESQASTYPYLRLLIMTKSFGFDPSQKLTADQEAVLASMLTLLERGAETFALHGAAGTGKTFTCGHLANELIKKHGKNSVLFITPTHAARRILIGKLPRGVKVFTVAYFIKSEATRVFDKIAFGRPPASRYEEIADNLKKNVLGGKDNEDFNLQLVVSDESSMITQKDADCIQGICRILDVCYALVGDPYQLPPVMSKEEQLAHRSTLSAEVRNDDIIYSKDMCSQFRDNSFLRLELKDVKRNKGEILKFSSSIRHAFKDKHFLPSSPAIDTPEDTGIYIARNYQDFIESAVQAALESKDGIDVAIIAHRNQTVRQLTEDFRACRFPDSHETHWNKGEAILLPCQTPFAPPINEEGVVFVEEFSTRESFYSTTYCEVKDVKVLDLSLNFGSFQYETKSTKVKKEFHFNMTGKFQKLTLKSIHFGTQNVVFRPIFTDGMPLKSLKRAKRFVKEMQKRKLIPSSEDPGYKDHPVGKILLCMDSFLLDINCANTMTIHKSQGATLDRAYIHYDLSFCQADYRNNLMYTATTRAGRQEIFLCLDSSQESVLPLLEIGKQQLALPPSERRKPKPLDDESIDHWVF